MQWNLVVYGDLQAQPVPEQLLAFSEAYLASAEHLCRGLCEAPGTVTYPDGAVVMSPTFHGLEVFFKAAILAKQPGDSFRNKTGHDMEALHRRFCNLYPGKAAQFDVPFTSEAVDMGGLDPLMAEEVRQFIEASKREQPEDQRQRYPINVNGKPWTGMFGFEAASFHRTLCRLRLDLAGVLPMIRGT